MLGTVYPWLIFMIGISFSYQYSWLVHSLLYCLRLWVVSLLMSDTSYPYPTRINEWFICISVSAMGTLCLVLSVLMTGTYSHVLSVIMSGTSFLGSVFMTGTSYPILLISWMAFHYSVSSVTGTSSHISIYDWHYQESWLVLSSYQFPWRVLPILPHQYSGLVLQPRWVPVIGNSSHILSVFMTGIYSGISISCWEQSIPE